MTRLPLLPQQRLLAKSAAILLVIGLLTGFYVASAMTGKLGVDAGAALASHLNALMGCFWIAAVGWSLPMVGYGDRGLTLLAWLTVVPNYANWAITALKAALEVKGIDATGEGYNDLVFGLLAVFVVLPSLAAAMGWAIGLYRNAPAAPARAFLPRE